MGLADIRSKVKETDMLAYCADCGQPQPNKHEGELHFENCVQHKSGICIACRIDRINDGTFKHTYQSQGNH